MSQLEDARKQANMEADKAFERLGKVLEAAVESGATELNVAEVAAEAGLKVNERVLGRLEVDTVVHCHRWLPWHVWFPWRPLWCWWWRRRYPWYRCCPYWWHRCYGEHHC